jgi:hypothetical protein
MKRYSIAIGSSVFLALLCSVWIVASPRHADAFTVSRTIPMPFTLAHGAFAEWTGGALVVIEGRFSNSPTLKTFDRDGKKVSEFSFTIPSAGLINIYDNSVAVGKDGSLAIVGTAYSNDSRGASFVAWVSPDRHGQTLIRPSSFFPGSVTIPSDGTIWVAGYKKRAQPGERMDSSHELILRYDRSGNLLGSVVPLPDAKPEPPDAPRHWRPQPILLPLGDRVGWYLPAEPQAYIEFSLDGSPVNRFKGPEQEIGAVISAAACTNGNVFVTSQINGKNWGIFSLDRERGDWTLTPREEKSGLLLGCDGTRPVAITGFSNVVWLEAAAH